MSGIIDYEFGNTQSVENSIDYLGFKKKNVGQKLILKTVVILFCQELDHLINVCRP